MDRNRQRIYNIKEKTRQQRKPIAKMSIYPNIQNKEVLTDKLRKLYSTPVFMDTNKGVKKLLYSNWDKRGGKYAEKEDTLKIYSNIKREVEPNNDDDDEDDDDENKEEKYPRGIDLLFSTIVDGGIYVDTSNWPRSLVLRQDHDLSS